MEAKVLDSGMLMDKILVSLDRKKPLSVSSLGSTQSYVMAQYKILSEKEFMNHHEALRTNRENLRGFTFPNVKLRDEMVKAVKKTDVIGYNIFLRHRINSGLMTEKVFEAYGIQPEYIFDSVIRRVIMFSQKAKFKAMLRERKIVLIGRTAEEAGDAINKRWGKRFPFEIVQCINMVSYNQMSAVKKTLDQTEYDLCLISAGVNSVILAPYIAREHGKVAFDIGMGMTSLITKKVVETSFVRRLGMEKLLTM